MYFKVSKVIVVTCYAKKKNGPVKVFIIKMHYCVNSFLDGGNTTLHNVG